MRMKTIKKLLKYKVDKKFVVFAIILLMFNIIIYSINLKHFYWFIFLFATDYYLLKYMLITTKEK
jgi:hypothetical protein